MKRLVLIGMSVAMIAAGLGTATSATAAAKTFHRFQIVKVYFDTPGPDLPVTNYKLNKEYVAIRNVTHSTYPLTGYVVSDASGHRHAFGTFSLGAGRTVLLHTGHGSPTSTNRYWQSSYYIWNNDGDTATLRNQYGGYVDSCSYTANNDPAKTC